MTDSTRMLDMEAVRAFVWIAQMRSFTRAAEALNSTQSALSLKLKKLEEHLGRRLLERTPRQVRLSAEGAVFLDAARALVDAHEQAVGTLHTPQRRLVIGLSHQIVGVQLPAVLRHMHSQQPQIQFELRVAGSRELLSSLDAGTLDAALIIQFEDIRRRGEKLFAEPYGWVASIDAANRIREPIPLATQGENCSIRNQAVRLLDHAGVSWKEVYVGQGAAALGAAAAAGLAVAVLARAATPQGTMDVGPVLKLPALPVPNVFLYSNLTDSRSRSVLRTLARAFKTVG